MIFWSSPASAEEAGAVEWWGVGEWLSHRWVKLRPFTARKHLISVSKISSGAARHIFDSPKWPFHKLKTDVIKF